MSGCDCEWLGDCSCEMREVPVLSPAKAVKIRLKTQENRGALAKEHATANEPTPSRSRSMNQHTAGLDRFTNEELRAELRRRGISVHEKDGMPKADATKRPATVREAGEMAEALGMKLSEFLDMLAPIPMPPAGYVLFKAGSDRWIGPELMGRRWILTAVWSAVTNETTIEVFTAKHVGEKYTNLTPAEALDMARGLVDLSEAITAGGSHE